MPTRSHREAETRPTTGGEGQTPAGAQAGALSSFNLIPSGAAWKVKGFLSQRGL